MTEHKLTAEERRRLLILLIGDGQLMAEADSKRDLVLQELEQRGVLECYDAMFGHHYYLLTESGRRAALSQATGEG